MSPEEARRAAPEFYPPDDAILYDDVNRVCAMEQHTFDRLHEYSGTIPSGKFIGKRWKQNNTYTERRQGPPEWYLRGYEECDPAEPDKIAIPVWKILVVA